MKQVCTTYNILPKAMGWIISAQLAPMSARGTAGPVPFPSLSCIMLSQQDSQADIAKADELLHLRSHPLMTQSSRADYG